MSSDPPPIPRRIPPLDWRKPSLLWTPTALALAIGWPAALFFYDVGLQRLALVAGPAIFALALITLGAKWALGRPPRARQTIVRHVVNAGLIASLAAPFVLARVLAVVADYEHAGAGRNFTLPMSLAMTPLALMLGLPIALISGVIFAWIALAPPQAQTPEIRPQDVQPFR